MDPKGTGNPNLSYTTHGDLQAPCVVLCQGLGMSAADWPDALVSGLSRDFHVLIPDNRDAGASPHWGPDHDCHALEQLALEALGKPFTAPFDLNSMRDDVIQLTETLGIQRYAILGFSMGGMIAQGVAAARPESVSAMIQVCSSAGEPTPPFPETTRRRFQATARGFSCTEDLVAWLADDIVYFSYPNPVPSQSAWKTAARMICDGFSSGAFARQYLAILATPPREHILKTIAAPALVIAGAEDRCIPAASSERAKELLPKADLHVLPDMGHTIEPQAVDLILDWLRSRLTGTREPSPATWVDAQAVS